MKKNLLPYLLLALLIMTSPVHAQMKGDKWLRPVCFFVDKFSQPALEFAPFARWWWPGNDVAPEELAREVELFAKNHIGGVEIQPMSLVMPTKGKGRADRIMSFDSPSYYNHLATVMDAALRYGLTVDLTNGSGWPSGGAHLQEEDNNLTIEYGMVDIPEKNVLPVRLPRAEKGDRPNARLVAVLAAKTVPAPGPTLWLEQETVVDVTSRIKDSTVIFTPEEDGWKLIAFWKMADMERPMLMASRDAGFAMNHFDSAIVAKNYAHFFGERTGLQKYMGHPLRSVFNDSYEFRADRHFSDDFIETFKRNRGYDPVPHLPANIWYGYNDMYQRMVTPNLRPKFGFSEQDWRLRYDYDLTLSDLIRRHLLRGSKNWLEPKGMLHRTQAYGLALDMLGAAGDASIPEMETMQFGRACEAGYKIISSGAHLYNRPVISCESAVYINRAFLTTPQKLKMTIDKVLVSGVNQIIWHGIPYRYFPEGYPKEGWYPFYNSALGVNFSTFMSETNPFWKYFGDINTYAQRAQYVLRSGKPQADVLIYYPFLKFSEAGANPKELLISGYIPGVEPALPKSDGHAFNAEEETAWINSIWPLIDELNARGITWDWINDESIQAISVNHRSELDVRGNKYKGLILFNLPYIQKATAEHLNTVAVRGGNILNIGSLPTMQPSYKDWQKNDSLTAVIMRSLMDCPAVTGIGCAAEIGSWADKLDMEIRSMGRSDCMRQTRRIMDGGALAQFYWNESEAWEHLSIRLAPQIRYAYWMNAEDGSIEAAEIGHDRTVEKNFGPLATAILYCTSNPVSLPHTKKAGSFVPDKAREVMTLAQWSVKADTLEMYNQALGDWRENDQLKYCGQEGTYTTRISVKKSKKTQYFLDLGKVYYSAELAINGMAAGKRIYAPFLFNVTPYLKNGQNEIVVKVTPSLYNEYVKRGIDKDRLFKTLKESPLASQGLAGPVKLLEM